jgi:hypothetical protein
MSYQLHHLVSSKSKIVVSSYQNFSLNSLFFGQQWGLNLGSQVC